MTKYSVRDSMALAMAMSGQRGHDTHGALWAERAGNYGLRLSGYLPDRYRPVVQHGRYAVMSYGTPIAVRCSLEVLDDLEAAGLYRVKSSKAETHECLWTGGDYAAVAVQGEPGEVWIIPSVKYSASTGTHQSTVVSALLHHRAGQIVRYI